MADKSRFGRKLTEADIVGSVEDLLLSITSYQAHPCMF